MIRSQERENRKDFHGYRWGTVIGGWEQRYANTLYVPQWREQRGAVVQWRARSLSLALSQRSSGKQQQHKPNPCNRVSASSTSVYSGVIQCPPPPAALSLVSNCPLCCILFDSVHQKRCSYFLHKRSDDYTQVDSLAWSSLLGKDCTWAQENLCLDSSLQHLQSAKVDRKQLGCIKRIGSDVASQPCSQLVPAANNCNRNIIRRPTL